MWQSKLASLVNQLIDLKRQKAALEEQIELIQGRFIEAAQGQLQEDGHKSFIGCSYSFSGLDGAIARVSFPEHKLISNFRFNDEDEAFRTQGTGKKAEIIKMPGLRKYAGEKFKILFAPFFKPATAFRELLPTHVGPASAERLLELCTEPSSPRVSTETAKTPSSGAS